MNKFAIHILIVSVTALSLSLIPGQMEAQHVNVQVELQPEVDAVVERPLDFGLIVVNSGLTRIAPGDPDMGVFSIRALQAQRLLFNLQAPDYIEINDSQLEGRIPMNLQASYTGFGIDDFQQARPMESLFEEIVLMQNQHNPASDWSTAYIYVYGSIDVGDVPLGTYSGEVVLTVEYE